MKRRDFMGVCGGVLATYALTARSAEETVRVVVGFPPGGSVDGLARITAQAISSGAGRSAVVENKPGAAGRIAVELVKNAAPDGRTLLVSPQGPMTLFPHIFDDLKFDPARDFTPIMRLGVSDMALSVGPMVSAQNFAQLVEWLQTAGDNATFGSPGAGTIVHFAGETIAQSLDVKMTHVPYQGSARSMIDLAGGAIAMAISPVTEALELHKAGRIRILVTTGPSRSPFVPDIPSMQELGYDVEVQGWNALYGPAGLSPTLVEELRAFVGRQFDRDDVKQQLMAQGIMLGPLSLAELEALREKEAAMWERIVSRSGFRSGV